MITLLKLGGSLVTDKTVEASFRADTVRRVAREIKRAFEQSGVNHQLIIGHGSGSFGHFAAKKYGTANGVHSAEDWHGFAEVAFIASKLNALILDDFLSEGLPIVRFQPSASVRSHDAKIIHMETDAIQFALQKGLIPLVYGDVAFDDVLGGTITSTETIFTYLTTHLPVQRIILLGEVEGVFDLDGNTIPRITPDNFDEIKVALGGSSGTDVTGGMITKVTDMLTLAQLKPNLTVQILNGTTHDLLFTALIASTDSMPGTIITTDKA
ncbi:MAG: isopentenyl phosphate kinase [Aggregatilineales bacterium]